jgi:hypothetical protein
MRIAVEVPIAQLLEEYQEQCARYRDLVASLDLDTRPSGPSVVGRDAALDPAPPGRGDRPAQRAPRPPRELADGVTGMAMVAGHWAYHAGELNAILAIRRGQAWEYGEEVEENHITTVGHRLRPAWMTDEQAAASESHRDEAGSGGSTAATRHGAGRPA